MVCRFPCQDQGPRSSPEFDIFPSKATFSSLRGNRFPLFFNNTIDSSARRLAIFLCSTDKGKDCSFFTSAPLNGLVNKPKSFLSFKTRKTAWSNRSMSMSPFLTRTGICLIYAADAISISTVASIAWRTAS